MMQTDYALHGTCYCVVIVILHSALCDIVHDCARNYHPMYLLHLSAYNHLNRFATCTNVNKDADGSENEDVHLFAERFRSL